MTSLDTTATPAQSIPVSRSAGHLIVDSLVAHGVKRAYVVPGESYLDVLDGLHNSAVETVVCRHEGGAAYMAESEGKLNQLPGIAMVTRGPGAANAHVGLHTAWQDSTPMVLFVGLIPFEHRDREAFQEFEPKAWFESGAKRVMVLDHPERASEIVAEAMFAAMSGRPGPVVVGLPEDVLREQVHAPIHPQIPVATGGMTVTDWKALKAALEEAERPLFVFGGNDWSSEGAETFTKWLEEHSIAAAAEWRCEGLVPFSSPSYVGPIGYGRPKPTYDLLEETDLMVFVGTVPGDVITNGFDIRQNWDQKNFIVTMDPSLRGRSGPVTHQIVSKPDTFVRDLVLMDLDIKPEWTAFTQRMRAEQEAFAAPKEARTDNEPATMDAMMAHLVACLPTDSMVRTHQLGPPLLPHRVLRLHDLHPQRVHGLLRSLRRRGVAELPGAPGGHGRRRRRIPHERPGTRHRSTVRRHSPGHRDGQPGVRNHPHPPGALLPQPRLRHAAVQPGLRVDGAGLRRLRSPCGDQ
jgi:acetolactate synthase-1/2/3 large subunit